MTDSNGDKDEVLRKIGRNVVILQKLEGMLKKLVLLQGATISADETERLRARAEAIAKRPLGHVVSEFLREAYPSPDSEESQPAVETRGGFSLSFTLDPNLGEDHKSTLSSVVSERNELIHQMLLSFDPNSQSSCRSLGDQLDAQLARVEPEYRFMQGLLASIKQSLDHVVEQIESGRTSDDH